MIVRGKMHVTVKLFANLTRFVASSSAGKAFGVELGDDATIQNLIDCLKIPPQETQVVFVNNIIEQNDLMLKDGDVVGIFPPIAGG